MLSLETIDKTKIEEIREALKSYLFFHHIFQNDEIDCISDKLIRSIAISAIFQSNKKAELIN